ncbi:hypothetical protein P7H46_12855 [Enterococcus pseudoavium]|uniref:Uncharacterized protein n=2 Tax=Enterococcus TaxID=1350 RepID=A0ABU3FKV9_9ENTE|nr:MULTISPECIES: hypothetical protein [Enterococcus]MDT2613395.1 hypothetical protein [Enterococcus dongliensis]MDT2771710.1 hypothetical protein [Enterococcus pseudoavium]
MKKKKATVFSILTVSLILSLSIIYNQTTLKKNLSMDDTKRSSNNSPNSSFFQDELTMKTVKDGKVVGTGKAKIIRRKIDPNFSKDETSNDNKFIINN